MKNSIYLALLTVLLFSNCEKDSDENPPVDNLPELNILDSRIIENQGSADMVFEVKATGTIETAISFNYTVEGISATPDEDFTATTGSATIEVGQTGTTINVGMLDDDINEVEEKFKVTIQDAQNATIKDAEAIGVIDDNDSPSSFNSDGYITEESYYGYELVWSDEFDGTELNSEDYNFELGDGCPNLCGWGNEELQSYTDDPSNINVENGLLTITATAITPTTFRSTRIQTKGKQEFEFGRIDIRAKLPEGQGIWPAIWMLGRNIDEVGWPACGEIDIMELVGHKPNVVHGTAHWGPQGRPNSTFVGSEYIIDEPFSEEFHVFSIVWEFNEIIWYVDETKFHTITPNTTQNEEYRFNQPFFFIFNVAVGGQWPGSPDETTVFPQKMEIDYVRVFQ